MLSIKMETQFTDLSVPDPNIRYYFRKDMLSKGWTHLMKLVLMVNKYPDAILMIKEIIKDPNTINVQNNKEHTALMIACANSNGCSNNCVVRMLINAGADMELGSGYKTALMLACSWNTESNTETVRILINSGANVNAVDRHGYNALMWACVCPRVNITSNVIKILIDAGADVNHKNNAGTSALIVMCSHYHSFGDEIEPICLLINAGSNIDLQNNNGYTASMITSNIEIIKLLISTNCNVNLKNNHGDTLLMNLLQRTDNYNDVIIDLIHRSRETLYDTNDYGKTAFDYYVEYNHSFLDEYHLKLLKGDIRYNNTKSAKRQ